MNDRFHRSSAKLPVLMYHSIAKEEPRSSDPLVVPVSRLRRHVATLTADGWELLGLTEALQSFEDTPSRRIAALTFDDGLLDFLNAVEVLDQAGARATIYVPTARVGIRGSLSNGVASTLGWDHLLELSRQGIEIGSHSRHHRPLDVCPPRILLEEIHGSRMDLEDRLGVTVCSFSFPHGYSSPRVRRAVIEAGYRNACIVGRRVSRLKDDRFSLPRLQVRPEVCEGELHRLVRRGEPGMSPTIKRVLHPGWRVVRLASSRLPGRELT
ncbi:MAG: polysaccharide deacetylase family protein [Pseudonocardiales bacterium]|nr:polysaccharide deacetylase family protein [Pseudonocardiales bacterium]